MFVLLRIFYLRALHFTNEIMDSQGKDSPVESKRNDKKRGWRIGIGSSQEFNKRQQGSYQNNFDRQYDCGNRALPGYG